MEIIRKIINQNRDIIKRKYNLKLMQENVHVIISNICIQQYYRYKNGGKSGRISRKSKRRG